MKTKRIKVKVTEEDIKNGDKGCERCPIALAVQRTTGNPLYRVLSNELRLERGGRPWGILVSILSKPVQKFIRKNDTNKIVKPTTFILNVKA